jgi:hypothetical protein
MCRELTAVQRCALADAAARPLQIFRRGYAPDRSGPFHRVSTIEALEARGLVERSRMGTLCRATAEGMARLAAVPDMAGA